MYKVITFFLLFFISTLYAQEPILVSAYIVDRYPAQIQKVAGDYKKKRYFFIRSINGNTSLENDSIISILKEDARSNNYENDFYIQTPPFTDSISNQLGQIRVRVKGKKSKLKYTSINGINTYIYLTYSLSGLAKYQIYDYDFLKFRNHLKENLSFWGDNIPLINPKKQCLGVYFFYDYTMKQVRLTGKP